MENKLSLPISIVIAGLLIAGSIFLSNMEKPSEKNQEVKKFEVAKVTQDEHIRGSLSSDIVVIEYSDTECPYCKAFHNTMKEVFDERGDFAWVYRHFPLSIHPKAYNEAVATECAADLGGNNAFWNYLDRIFEITPSNNGLDVNELPKIAEYSGLNVSEFEKCLSSGKYDSAVAEDLASGESSGVEGTPYTIILNQETGKTTIIKGAQPKEAIIAAIESLIE
jgi:protein-disulfide isomerase